MLASTRAALKTTFRALINRLGGYEAAAAACERSPSRLHGYADPTALDRFVPVDVLAELESCAGVPLVTAALARASGFMLVRQAAPGPCGVRAVGEALGAIAPLLGNMAAALLDHHISPAERAQMLPQLEAAASAIATAHATLSQAPLED